MDNIQVKDKSFSLFISAEEIDQAVSEVAAHITQDLRGKNPLFIIVLNGAYMFAADLIRKFDFDCEISFVRLSSYAGMETTSKVREVIGLYENLTDREVVIVEDIIDTGISMAFFLDKIRETNVKSVRLGTLLFKPDAFRKNYHIDYVGIKIPNEFIVGYGLDYDGLGRNYPDIYKIVE
ncbi:MAG: hypoxanthine phosphoribosyltransferase [Bacteroidota bacterium]|nr:hypoxanthine phosphoribosyltransferase [Bacteroidota bacterium]